MSKYDLKATSPYGSIDTKGRGRDVAREHAAGMFPRIIKWMLP